MRCPYCGHLETQVKDSRPAEDSASIRRRRVCPGCSRRFTTSERVQLRELMVIKKSGRRVLFDRDKLFRSLEVALRKRFLEPERVECMVNGIVQELENSADPDVTSSKIGQLMMAGLKHLDLVAYIRFASVYCNFKEVRDFIAMIEELSPPPSEEDLSPARGVALPLMPEKPDGSL